MGALVAEEKEELVFEDGTAHGTAEDVLMVRRRGRQARFLVVAEGVEEGVAIELEAVAMKLVGTLFDGGADNAAGVAVVFSIQGTFDEVELVDRVEVGLEGRVVQRNVIGVGAVDQVLRLLGLCAAHGEGAGKAVGGHLHAGLDELQICEVAADEGELFDIGGVDDVAELRVGGVDLDGVRLNFDDFRGAANFQLDQLDVFLVDGDRNSSSGEGFESGSRGADGVGAHGKLLEDVLTI